MIVAFLLAGFGLGLVAGCAMLVSGYPWWMALLGYGLTGAAVVILTALAFAALSAYRASARPASRRIPPSAEPIPKA